MGSTFAESDLHPFDPLTASEIEKAISIVKKAHGDVFFNVVALQEPRKAEMTAWLQGSSSAPKPKRVADVVVIAPGGKVYDGLIDMEAEKITSWELLDGLQPIVSITHLTPKDQCS
jgi:primary-amine oxidase